MGKPLRLKRHKIEDVHFIRARDIGREITPELVILHDTAGRLESRSSVGWLKGNPGKASVHFVIERDGEIVQMVPTNRRANHAGRSHYHGRDGVNGFSVGIEIVNPGKMILSQEGKARAWWGQEFDLKQWRIQPQETDEHGGGWWMHYTPEQLWALNALLVALFDGIPSLRDIRPHWYVSPGRKVDTNPFFPLEQVRARILGRNEVTSVDADDASIPAQGSAEMVWINCPGDLLNMREWPSFNPNVIARIPDQARVPVIRRGVFAGRAWIKVAYAGREGWIVENYTMENG